ncbi:hypothetical protein KQX54_013162 [Cotesia glomerata]|uniref:Acetyl-CoA hydrolase/transferase C-terminal domain-containing protein n=1 Tax=Cotesia glomerata TaxID=32391 RepID=A0AAV7HZF0_COTGL|nr:hypothetical protein KQX54_013162 [Cotesia glomerata]
MYGCVTCIWKELLHLQRLKLQFKLIKISRGFLVTQLFICHIDFAIEHNEPLPAHPITTSTDKERTIVKHIAENLVADGATFHLGIGSIPDGVLSQLKSHKNLGINSEIFSNSVVDLVNIGCITVNKKSIHRVDYSIGTRMYCGFGGQVDFLTGATMSKDDLGQPIVTLNSTTADGKTSKISPVLKLGDGVVTSRALVRYAVTEDGIASLFDKTLKQRAHELINVAHPNHREALEKAAFQQLKGKPEP